MQETNKREEHTYYLQSKKAESYYCAAANIHVCPFINWLIDLCAECADSTVDSIRMLCSVRSAHLGTWSRYMLSIANMQQTMLWMCVIVRICVGIVSMQKMQKRYLQLNHCFNSQAQKQNIDDIRVFLRSLLQNYEKISILLKTLNLWICKHKIKTWFHSCD